MKLGLVALVGLTVAACGGSYPTPTQGIAFDSDLTSCLDAGSRAAFDSCEATTVAAYCVKFPALQVCVKDGGAE